MSRGTTIKRRKWIVSIVFSVCVIAAALFAPNEVRASDLNDIGISDDSSDDNRTVINPSGSAETRDDLKELNVSNNLSITYQDGDGNVSGTLRILITLTLIALAPTLLVMMTSFTRIIIVMHFVRSALGTQSAPPNIVLIGLSLFLTFFIMNPVITEVNETAVVPFEAGQMDQQEFFETALVPLREFMYGQTMAKDVRLFLDIEGIDTVPALDDIPTRVLIPSFVLSELRTAFIIGFLLYIPFIIIDMVVASTLMSMGMMMLPPTTISMPFKILLFVLADGWNLVIGNLVRTFY